MRLLRFIGAAGLIGVYLGVAGAAGALIFCWLLWVTR